MSSAQATFSCENCGKLYPWKPELAGKKAKCKCGHVLEVPAETAPVEPDPLDALDEYGLAPEPVASPATSRASTAAAAPTARKAASARQSGGDACPGCGASLAAGAVICVECGYNVKTGKRMGTAVAAGAAPAAAKGKAQQPPKPTKGGKAAPVAKRRGRGGYEDDDGSAKKKQIVTMVGLAVLVIGLVVGARFYFAGGDDSGIVESNIGDDADAIRRLREDAPIEAKEFLEAHESRNLGNAWTRNVGMMKVDQWYKLGAAKVWAFTGLISSHVVIELPQGAEARKPLLDWYNKWLTDHGDEPLPGDDGRKYLVLNVMGG